MRANVVLLLTALTLLLVGTNSVSGSAVKLHTSQDQVGAFNGRALRTGERTDEVNGHIDEERAFADFTKKLGTRVKEWAHDKKLAVYVEYQAAAMDKAKTTEKFMKKNLTPDQVFNYLKLYKKRNRYYGDWWKKEWSHEFLVWKEYSTAWTKAHPKWKTKLDLKSL